MGKVKRLVIFLVICIIHGCYLIELMAASIAVTPELDKKRESLPFIFSVMIGYGNPYNTIEDFKYMRKYYGVNDGFSQGWPNPKLYVNRTREELEASDEFKLLAELKKHGFSTSVYQGGSTAPLHEDLPLPGAVDEQGNKNYYNPSHYTAHWRADQISEMFFTNRVKPKIDLYSDMGADILRVGEYGFYFLAYSETDIKQFRKDLLEEDSGIEWQFHSGQVKKIHFWEYAKAQLGIRKEDFKPASLGNFTSYKEYVPAKIRGGGDHGDFLQHSNNWFPAKAYDSGEKYWRNVNLHRYLYEYEYFKRCQSWFIYAKQKGFKYIAWGPNGQFYRDTPHDPYVDYMDIRFGQGRVLMLPGQEGGGGYASDPRYEYVDIGANRTWRYLRNTSTLLGKPGLGAYEPAPLGRLPKTSYEVGFGQVLVFSTLAKPKFIYPEFPVLECIFDTGLSYTIRQSGICGYDAYRQLITSKLYNGSILKSNWLILNSVLQYNTFGFQGIPPRQNFGDMKTELLLNEGYIPDANPSNGTDGVSFDDYKVITMGGVYYNPIVIDRLKDWLEKGSNRTLFTNFLFLGQYLWGHNEIDGKRYTNLGIWNTSDIVEREIEYVTWADKNILPNVRIGKYSLRAAVPSNDIMANLPGEAKVVMKGKTVSGIEVPLVVILPKAKNRIINITFAMEEYTFSNVDEYLGVKRNPNLEFARDTMQDLFNYVQKEDIFSITRVKCDYPYKMIFREIATDNKGVATLCALASPGQRLGLSSVDPLILEYENHKVVTKIEKYAPIIASLDGSVLVSGSPITVDETQYVKKVDPETIYVLAAIDDKSYHDSKLFHLWTYEPTTISFLKPKTWEHKNKIKIYAFNPNVTNVVEVSFKLKDEYIEIKTEGAIEAKLGLEAKGGVDYKICYGEMEESSMKEFSNRLAPKEEIPKTRFDDSDWNKGKLIDMPIITQTGGNGWYRLHVNIPKEWQDNSLVLDLGIERQGSHPRTYFNGKHQHTENMEKWGETKKQRRYIIPKKIIRYGEDNVIAVNVYNWTNGHPIRDGYVRLINPAKGETIDLFNLEWLSKKGIGERTSIKRWTRY